MGTSREYFKMFLFFSFNGFKRKLFLDFILVLILIISGKLNRVGTSTIIQDQPNLHRNEFVMNFFSIKFSRAASNRFNM